MRINDTWTLTLAPPPAAVWLGHEGDPGWTGSQAQAGQQTHWTGADGWGYARIALAAGRACRVTLHNSVRPQPNPLTCPAVRALLIWICRTSVLWTACTPRLPIC